MKRTIRGFAAIDNDACGSISLKNQSRSTYFWILVVDMANWLQNGRVSWDFETRDFP